jgi:hypothetical protein
MIGTAPIQTSAFVLSTNPDNRPISQPRSPLRNMSVDYQAEFPCISSREFDCRILHPQPSN